VPQKLLLVDRNRSARPGTAIAASGERSARNATGSSTRTVVRSFTGPALVSWASRPPAEMWPPAGEITPPSLQYA